MLIFATTIAVYVSTYAFASLVCVPVGITSSAVGLEICANFAGIKKQKSIIEKKMKKYDQIVLLGKTKLDIIEVLISKALIDSFINHDKFVSVNNVLRKYNKMKEEIKTPETSVEHII